MKKIVVACASGVATSAAIAGQVRRMLKAKGLDVKVDNMSLGIVQKHYKEYDVYLAIVPNPPKDCPIPVLPAIPFLTGIGLDKEMDELIRILSE